jgi:hypothetical protein
MSELCHNRCSLSPFIEIQSTPSLRRLKLRCEGETRRWRLRKTGQQVSNPVYSSSENPKRKKREFASKHSERHLEPQSV